VESQEKTIAMEDPFLLGGHYCPIYYYRHTLSTSPARVTLDTVGSPTCGTNAARGDDSS
jgi:hypothetical protein